jgi:hypothetical protein
MVIAVVLAHAIGVIDGIISYMNATFDQAKNELVPFQEVRDHLWKARDDAHIILRNIYGGY